LRHSVDREEAQHELLGLGRVGGDRTRNEAQIDAGVLRLPEGLRVEKHAHRRRHMRIIGLGAVVIDPLLNHAQRGARIDLRRDRTCRGLNQHEQGDDQAYETHVMLPDANCQKRDGPDRQVMPQAWCQE
jgi:hypothetical protein